MTKIQFVLWNSQLIMSPSGGLINSATSTSTRLGLEMTARDDSQSDNELYALELQLWVTERLSNRVRSLWIEVLDEGVILNGNCDSYHVKQLAQEIVSKCTSRRILSNLILVRDMTSGETSWGWPH